MELKYFHVNQKQYSDELLISQEQVYLLKKLLTELIHSEVVIINTSLGLEIYYESSNDHTQIIKNILALVVDDMNKMNDCLEFYAFQNEKEIYQSINGAIVPALENPEFVKYLKNMLGQLKQQHSSNEKLIGKLSGIWRKVKRNLSARNVGLKQIQPFQADLQDIYINNIRDKVVRELVVGAVDKKFAN